MVGRLLFHLFSLHFARADRGEWLKRQGRGREGRIKTNPLCERVLVAMATIITSHLGEQERGEKGGGAGGRWRRVGGVGREGKGRKTGQRWGRETRRQDAVEGKRGKMKCQIPGSGHKCQGGEGGKSVMPQCQWDNFSTQDPPPPPEEKDHHRLRSAVKCQSLSQYARGNDRVTR